MIFAHGAVVTGMPTKFECSYCQKVFSRQRGLTEHTPRCPMNGPVQFKRRICKTCNYSTNSLVEFETHINTKHVSKHKREKFPCAICKKVFYGANLLDHHNAQTDCATSVKTQCKYCGMRCRTIDKLEDHQLGFHKKEMRKDDEGGSPIKRNYCQKCKANYGQKKALANHIQKYHPDHYTSGNSSSEDEEENQGEEDQEEQNTDEEQE